MSNNLLSFLAYVCGFALAVSSVGLLVLIARVLSDWRK